VNERFWIQASHYAQSEGTYDMALDVCRKGLKLCPGDPHAMTWLGRRYLDVEDHGQAAKILQRAVDKGSVNPCTFVLLGGAYNSLGDDERGRRAAELGLSVLPGDVSSGTTICSWE